jgi:formate/nitrite transporter FocA (FNT family)
MLVSPNISFGNYLYFEIFAILGNAIGGVVFVGIVKYGQRSGEADKQ